MRAFPPARTSAAAILRLTGFLLLGAAVAALQARIVPPGNSWSLSDTLACLILIGGAFLAGRKGCHPALQLLYGMLGGMVVGVVYLPDSRDWIGIRMGQYSFARFAAEYCAFVVFLGFLCRAAGMTGTAGTSSASARGWRVFVSLAAGYLVQPMLLSVLSALHPFGEPVYEAYRWSLFRMSDILDPGMRHPRLVLYAHHAMLTLILALPVYGLLRSVTERRGRSEHGCLRCGYDLTGNTSGVCPECGERKVEALT